MFVTFNFDFGASLAVFVLHLNCNGENGKDHPKIQYGIPWDHFNSSYWGYLTFLESFQPLSRMAIWPMAVNGYFGHFINASG